MPELPEVETVCRGLAARLEGRTVVRAEVRRPDLRLPLPVRLAERLAGRRVERVARRAKYLLIHLDDGMVLLGHLGMSGRMVVSPAAEPFVPGAHDHVILETGDGFRVVFHDPRRFGLLDLVPAAEVAAHPCLASLGPEPLGEAFTPEALSAALAGRFTPIKAALLDQKIVAGLGNIYVCESLFWAGIAPTRLAGTVAGEAAGRLVPAIRSVLTRAIAAGGSSLRNYVQASGELGWFQHDWAVYGRAGLACPGCTCDLATTGGIRRVVQANRSTFFCPVRQV